MGDRIASFKEKVEKNPNQVFFRYSLAQAYFEEGAFEQASAEFRKCLEVRPDWMIASLFVGKAEMETGNSQLAGNSSKRPLPWPKSSSRRPDDGGKAVT